MRIALIPLKALGLLVRHRCLLLIAAVAALFILPIALSRDPEICVPERDRAGLRPVPVQAVRPVLGNRTSGREQAQRRAAERALRNKAKEGAGNDDGN